MMRMQPDFEKANEIYFRLGIIYKQQSKYQQSLEVTTPSSSSSSSSSLLLPFKPSSRQIDRRGTDLLSPRPVLPIHHQRSASPFDGRGHLVPDRACARAAEGCRSLSGPVACRPSLASPPLPPASDRRLCDGARSTIPQRPPTAACWTAIPDTPRSSSS